MPYFSVPRDRPRAAIDWDWLAGAAAVAPRPQLVRARAPGAPLDVAVDGRTRRGVSSAQEESR